MGRCPLCQRAGAPVLYQKDGIPVCRCGACCLVFAPSSEVVAVRGEDDTFYSLDYFNGRPRSGYVGYSETADALAATARRLLSTVLAARPSLDCLLEIGSGGGQFLAAAAPHFGRVYGVEICEGICTRPLAPNVTLFERKLESIRSDELGAKATVIVMWDVVEHFREPREAIAMLGDLAAPGCLLFLTTGNVASAVARLMGRHWRLMTPLEHYSFFSPRTIALLLEEGGFRLETVSSPWKWVPVCLIAAQLGRMAGVARNAWRRIPPSWRVPMKLGDTMLVQARRA